MKKSALTRSWWLHAARELAGDWRAITKPISDTYPASQTYHRPTACSVVEESRNSQYLHTLLRRRINFIYTSPASENYLYTPWHNWYARYTRAYSCHE